MSNITIPEEFQSLFNSEKFSVERGEYTGGMCHVFIKDFNPSIPLMEQQILKTSLFHPVLNTHILNHCLDYVEEGVLPFPVHINEEKMPDLLESSDVVCAFKMMALREKLEDIDRNFEEELEDIFNTIKQSPDNWSYLASRT